LKRHSEEAKEKLLASFHLGHVRAKMLKRKGVTSEMMVGGTGIEPVTPTMSTHVKIKKNNGID
jgi:hypothetical protein